jgi:hypothetical protein
MALKIFDRKVRKIRSLAVILEKCDYKIREVIELGIYYYNRSKKISRIFITEFLPAYFYEQLVKMKDRVAKKYYSAGDSFRGRRVLRSDGSVSFFLEKLSEDKNKSTSH